MNVYELFTAILEHGRLTGADLRAFAATCKIANQCLGEARARAKRKTVVLPSGGVRNYTKVCSQRHGVFTVNETTMAMFSLYDYGVCTRSIVFTADSADKSITLSEGFWRHLKNYKSITIKSFHAFDSAETLKTLKFKGFNYRSYMSDKFVAGLELQDTDGETCRVIALGSDEDRPFVAGRGSGPFMRPLMCESDPLLKAAYRDLQAMIAPPSLT